MTTSEHPDALLSDLCAICHINPLKYTCPRCGIHTCSLACVKRHKKWAQCSGIRDPAAFRKRQELATPSSIDQDFNFITNVERSLRRADDQATERGIDLKPAGILKPYLPTKSKFEQQAEDHGTVIIRAPKGLSRSKQNRSHWDQRHKCVMWTIEWILPDDRKVLANAQDIKSLIEAYRITVGKKGLPRKRPMEEPESDLAAEREIKDISGKAEKGAELTNASSNTGFEHLHFYLHRPNTPSKFRCLIPLVQLESLAEALRERTVVEFPTIYVRYEEPDSLKPPYILESRYLELTDTDTPIDLPAYTETTPAAGEADSVSHAVDSEHVLEVLKQDLGHEPG